MITLYLVRKTQNRRITLADMSSLDAITRQLPEGYYSTFRTYDGCTRVIGLSSHLRRLPSADTAFLRQNLRQLLEPYRPRRAEARVRVMETKGQELYVALEPLKPLPPEIYEKGVRVETTIIQRHDPRAKSTAFISASDEERKHLAREGILEALLVKNGKILEGMTSNFFYILTSRVPENHRDDSPDAIREPGVLSTAQKGILLGVTRMMVIRVARRKGLEVRYRPLAVSQVPSVKEAFITSSSRGIVPVIQIDEIQVGQGRVGKITEELIQAYNAYVMKKAEKI